MTAQPSGGVPRTSGRTDHARAPAPRGAAFAGVVLAISGVLGILQGASAIAKNDPYTAVVNYAYGFNVTAWGWIHLLFGAALVVVGLCLLIGMPWAKGAGVLLAATTMALQFIFLPYYPVWAMVAIALDVLVLWALLVYSNETAG
ncbi:hypothetical protein G3I60_02250 [Streptomyces sp. SID13666]|uniref:DUF7144 family membrane protein n=1 Tax=unclassified Streptomyces TaxID=2593676 RepID=UPI0013C246AE|nr:MULTISPECIES: hypothetical protein [unclassified Streptomyces]NEA53029.1 hypothetical protein [Streptomyces sp. SID13666]NEA69644.1 hypothetical protein [Streptomyces sp. SID13588]